MITNYNEYMKELKRIQKERDKLFKKECELSKKEREIRNKIVAESYPYMIELFEKKLKPYAEENRSYYMLNSKIGIYILKFFEHSSEITIHVVYKKANKKGLTMGKTRFRWNEKDSATIEEFVDYVISSLEKLNAAREKAELSRVAKKYNM